MATDNLIKNAWMQGSFVKHDDLKKLFPNDDLPSEKFGIVISHPCDLHCFKLKKDPYVEIIFAKEHKLTNASKMYMDCKNPRILVIQCIDTTGDENREFFIEISTHDRHRLNKREFFDIEPNQNYTLQDKIGDRTSSFAHWLGMKYNRPFLPDEFDKRIKKSLTETKSIEFFDKHANYLHSLNLNLADDSELTPEQSYYVTILALMSSNSNQNVEQLIKQQLDRLQKSLKDLNVNLLYFIKNEIDFSVRDFELYQRWIFDDLSISKKHESGLY